MINVRLSRCSAELKAQKSDPGFITKYAEENPVKEDLPESALFAYTLIKALKRLPKVVAQAVRETMPNRLAYFEKLFAGMEENGC